MQPKLLELTNYEWQFDCFFAIVALGCYGLLILTLVKEDLLNLFLVRNLRNNCQIHHFKERH